MNTFFTRVTLPLLLMVFSLPAWSQPPAPDFTVTTSDGEVKQLYQDYINLGKVVVIEAFFTTCPPCAAHAPFFQNLYTDMQAAFPGKVEFMLLSTLQTDNNVKVAQYKTTRNLTMPGVGKDGGSITALQPYLSGTYGPFQGTPTFFIIAPSTGLVSFNIQGNSPSNTMSLLQAKIEELLQKECRVQNAFGAPLTDLQIQVDTPNFDTTLLVNGAYELFNIPALKNTAYTLKPLSNAPPTGLTTYDLVLISKHILSIAPLDCDWQLTAADINCSGSITTFDIVLGRQNILGIISDLPCGNMRFLPDSALVTNGNCQDFRGVFLGDLNAGPASNCFAGSVDSRAAPLELMFEDRVVQAEERVSIPLFFNALQTLEGFQLALQNKTDWAEIRGVTSSELPDFGSDCFHLSEQQLAVSWVYPHRQSLSPQTALLRLDIQAKKGGKLSDILQLAAQSIASEAYDEAGKIHSLQLRALPAIPAVRISPNPATDFVTLQLDSPTTGEGLLQFVNAQGQIIGESNLSYSRGSTFIDLPVPTQATGLVYVLLNGVRVGKLILGL